jgi:hypothetical protein
MENLQTKFYRVITVNSLVELQDNVNLQIEEHIWAEPFGNLIIVQSSDYTNTYYQVVVIKEWVKYKSN